MKSCRSWYSRHDHGSFLLSMWFCLWCSCTFIVCHSILRILRLIAFIKPSSILLMARHRKNEDCVRKKDQEDRRIYIPRCKSDHRRSTIPLCKICPDRQVLTISHAVPNGGMLFLASHNIHPCISFIFYFCSTIDALLLPHLHASTIPSTWCLAPFSRHSRATSFLLRDMHMHDPTAPTQNAHLALRTRSSRSTFGAYVIMPLVSGVLMAIPAFFFDLLSLFPSLSLLHIICFLQLTMLFVRLSYKSSRQKGFSLQKRSLEARTMQRVGCNFSSAISINFQIHIS